jgi:hypothetical protein
MPDLMTVPNISPPIPRRLECVLFYAPVMQWSNH